MGFRLRFLGVVVQGVKNLSDRRNVPVQALSSPFAEIDRLEAALTEEVQ